MKPVIGITICSQSDTYSLKKQYCDCVERSGGTPILLPSSKHTAEVASLCDGIIFSGGGDISPSLCGFFEYDPIYLNDPSPERDRFEISLAKLAFENNIPALGICRGIQIMNVALGGTLHFHIGGHMQKLDKDQPSHGISLIQGTALYKLLGIDAMEVNSLHHQAVNTLSPKLAVSALASDCYIEAVEAEEKRFFLGVQWHPEHLTGHATNVIFAALCQAAAAYKNNRG